ncbi:WD repeat and SOCS box-containing protein 2 [Trichomycterus rosablanca]|uniref:WD repeat and SOCS box-containing protein 2 n=1 Tax=Trichomycterus rosablanca TaxID=2290929 RepID=UPI002F35A2FF
MEEHTRINQDLTRLLCSARKNTKEQDGVELIAELKPSFQPRLYGSPGCETWSVCFSPDGAYFAWSSGYGIVRLLPWPLPPNLHGADCNSEEKTLDCGNTVWGMSFGPRSSHDVNSAPKSESRHDLLLATGLNDGLIKVWVVSTGKLLFNLTGHKSVVRDLHFTPNGRLNLVSASRDKTLRVWDLEKKGTPSHVLTSPKYWQFKCSVSADSSMIASVCNLDSKVYLWSLRSYTLIRNLKYDDERTMVSCDFSMDGALLAVGSFRADTGWSLDLWDPYTADHLTKIMDCDMCVGGNNNILTAFCFSPVASHLAFKDYRVLQIWDLEQDKLVLESDYSQVSGLCCAFHPHGIAIATGSRDGHVKFWRVPRLVSSLQHLCRTALRYSVSTYQVRALPLPKKTLEFLTYRSIPDKKILRCSKHYS